MKGDFSQLTYRPERPYSSVRMQQGRVPLDADWNEQVDIDAHLWRRAIADIIGGCCIPASRPDSFRVSLQGGQLRVEGGRAWVRGVLCERDDAQTLAPPTAAGQYVVTLEAFERHVTAIEDPDIREIALGGPDTATRTETVCRARVDAVGAGQTCASLADFTPPGQTTGELTASTGSQPPETPCVVPAAAGYARLDNQLYRVEIQQSGTIGAIQPPTYKWSRDNGSITAEWLELDGNEIVIENAGRDDLLGFQENRWIELGHDDLDIAGETGPLVEVVGRRTDSEGRYRLEIDAHGQLVPDPATLNHPKVRRWDHDIGSSPLLGGITIAAPNTPVALEGGILVSFSAGTYRSGDYWMIPARTFIGDFIGDILWPRDGAGNSLPQPPHGVARFFCRLAVIQVTATGGTQLLEDCRRTFPTLCGISRGSTGCCTVTVGSPGGDVATIAEALALLPQDGGEICLLPGDYRERVVITGRANITIRGCGRRSRIIAPDANAAVSLVGVQRVALRSLDVEALTGLAVQIERADGVSLTNLEITARDQSAISAIGARRLDLLESQITHVPLVTPLGLRTDRPPAVFLAGDDLNVVGNRILAAAALPQVLAGGGLQIGGGSDRVHIRSNVIDRGVGPGIMLGSVSTQPTPPRFSGFFDSFVARSIDDPAEVLRTRELDSAIAFFAALRRQPTPTLVATDAAGGFFVLRAIAAANVISDGDLSDIVIAENHILNMGCSGIAPARFFDLQDGQGDFISVDRLEIIGNRIEDCLLLRQEALLVRLAEDSALGGITLADVNDLVVRDNDIERNGIGAPIVACGVFLLHGRGIEIHRNRIRHNGPPPTTAAAALPDRRGGIVLAFAEVPTRDVRLTPTGPVRRRQDGTPAARVHDNIVIAPQGRALELIALGPVSVQANQFTALGADFQNRPSTSPLGLEVPEGSPLAIFTSALGGAVVLIINLGVSNEFYFQLAGFSGLNLAGNLAQPEGDTLDERPVLAGGNVLFQDNQVVLDALDSISTLALSSISLFTMDDIGMSGNQSDCDLVLDLAATNALLTGLSLRATDNRFKEGLINAFLSALTIGLLNSTTTNQGTHCFVRVAPVLPASHENTVLLQRLPAGENACGNAATLQTNLTAALFPH